MRRIVLAVCVTIMGAISVGAGASHVSAGGSYPSRHHHGDYDLWTETTRIPNQNDPCFDGDASLCPSTGTFDYYAELEGPAKVAGPPDYVDLFCDTVTVSGGYLHQDWTELYGPETDIYYPSTLTSLQGLGVVLQPGPTSTHGSAGLFRVSAGGSWHNTFPPPSSFTGTGSASGAYATGPQDPNLYDGYGRITAGKIHISITGTLSHWVRPVTDKGYNWVANPTTQRTMTCDVVPSPVYSDAFVDTSPT